MPDGNEATVRFSNASGGEMLVWLEPWAQEFQLPHRGELSLRYWVEGPGDPTPELNVSQDTFTVYGAAGTCVAVFIDGVDQNSFSAECPAPDAGPLTTRGFVDLVFNDVSRARPGGRPAPIGALTSLSNLKRVLRRISGRLIS